MKYHCFTTHAWCRAPSRTCRMPPGTRQQSSPSCQRSSASRLPEAPLVKGARTQHVHCNRGTQRLTEVDDLRSVGERSIEQPLPARGRLARPVRHHIVEDAVVVGAIHRLVGANAGLEHVLAQLVHLLRPDGAPLPRPHVALGPRHREAASAEEIDPPDGNDPLPVSEAAKPRVDREREARTSSFR